MVHHSSSVRCQPILRLRALRRCELNAPTSFASNRPAPRRPYCQAATRGRRASLPQQLSDSLAGYAVSVTNFLKCFSASKKRVHLELARTDISDARMFELYASGPRVISRSLVSDADGLGGGWECLSLLGERTKSFDSCSRDDGARTHSAASTDWCGG